MKGIAQGSLCFLHTSTIVNNDLRSFPFPFDLVILTNQSLNHASGRKWRAFALASDDLSMTLPSSSTKGIKCTTVIKHYRPLGPGPFGASNPQYHSRAKANPSQLTLALPSPDNEGRVATTLF